MLIISSSRSLGIIEQRANLASEGESENGRACAAQPRSGVAQLACGSSIKDVTILRRGNSASFLSLSLSLSRSLLLGIQEF